MHAPRRLRRPPRTGALASLDDFEQLYRSMSAGSLVFFTRRTADPEIARDLWAETWARAYEGRERFRGSTESEKKGWVLGIGRKVLAGYYKRGAVQQRAMARLELERPELDDADLATLEEAARLGELRAELGRALAAIPSSQREALRLRVVEGRSYPEVAHRLGINEETARARVSRGLRALSRYLDARFDELEAPHGA